MTRPLPLLLLAALLLLGSACSARQAPAPDLAFSETPAPTENAAQSQDSGSDTIAATSETDTPVQNTVPADAASRVVGASTAAATILGEFTFLELHPMFMDDPELAFEVVTNAGLHTGLAADEYAAASVPDPLEGWNRFWFNFNDALYTAFFEPVGSAYNYVVPTKARIGVRNFFDNLKSPVYIVNSLLQGKFLGAGVHMSRFIGNTAFGFLGFAGTFNDKEAVVETDREDFGQTLAVWGVGDGFYLVLPILGPTTLRDGIGMGVDSFLEPTSYISPWPFWPSEPWQWWAEFGVEAYGKFNAISFRLDYYDDLKATALSPYTAMRDAYIQLRRNKIAK